MVKHFGALLDNANKKTNIKSFINQDTMELDYLFKNSNDKLEKLTVIEAERQLALENLRKLTQELKDRRLNYDEEPKFNFFTKEI